MSNKSVIIKQCNRLNMTRNVFFKNLNHDSFFRSVYGNLAISGSIACNTQLLTDMIKIYVERQDMSTILLTSHMDLLTHLKIEQDNNNINGVMLSCPSSINYHIGYGMTPQQICTLFRVAGEELGCTALMDRVILYSMSIIKIVSKKYKISLPAISELLKNNDEFIVEFARQEQMPDIIINDILSNHEAGIMLRRIVELLKETFENVASCNNSKYNFQSACLGRVPVMAFYQPSRNQRLMNNYLKEELYSTLKRVPKVRIIIDEIFFTEDDELLKYLTQLKRKGNIELIAISKNILDMLHPYHINFENACMFHHSTFTETEEVSEKLFGSFQYHYPVLTRGTPPTVFFTLKTDSRWAIATEERLRIRPVDLYGINGIFQKPSERVAIKTANDMKIYITSIHRFLA